MNWFDWLIVIGLNLSIISYGIYLARGIKTSSEWFLAGRTLPWWIIGLSLYATAIDASDLVADSGGTYQLGFSYFIVNMVGVTFGWALAAFVVFLPMYRAGMYTNAEYLEARFGPALRILCALVQVQYRTLVLGIIGCSLYATLRVVCEWDSYQALAAVIGVAVFASIYTAFGGLKSVAITDALQFLVMTGAALVIWFSVLHQLGGWNGFCEKLEAVGWSKLLHTGSDHVASIDVKDLSKPEIERQTLTGGTFDLETQTITRTTPAWLVAIGFFAMGLSYPIVNQTQSMRMFAAQSEWDFKMCACLAGLAMIVMSFFNLSMGVFGRALVPDPAMLPEGKIDNVYPYLVSQFSVSGLKGLVVAGIFAASFSTYDSIGSSISALLTRDVYARLFVRDRSDEHYLRAGQWFTPLVIAISFAYMPLLLKGGMLLFYIDLTSAFVAPLLTVFLMGTMTRVGRRSGLIGLLVGSSYGMTRMLAPWLAEDFGIAVLPSIAINSFAAYPLSMALTAGTMVLHSVVVGWEKRGFELHQEAGWLGSSRAAVQASIAASEGAKRNSLAPGFLAIATVVVGMVICFGLFW